MNIRIKLDVKISCEKSHWIASIESEDEDSKTVIKTQTSGNKNIDDCLARLETEFKIIMRRYKEIYAIKG